MKRILVKETVGEVSEKVLVQGWVNSVRSHGKITFFDLRDRSGLLQVVVQGVKLKPEDIVSVVGTVALRPDKLVNPKLTTGTVELQAEQVDVLSSSRELPFPLDTDGLSIDEDLRLKYRYLDLRRSRLQTNLRLRSEYVKAIREYFFEKEFVEIETPILTKSTPEGSRDFVVPSRHFPGKFYALPQSPQQYKQLLMTAGFERYFQIARCLRDEDPRADRAYEHTQLDMEMSFVDQKEVMDTIEGMIKYSLDKVGFGDKILNQEFPVFTYKEAMEKFGEDKFDLRTEEEKKAGKLAFAWVVDFPFFEKTEDGGWTFTHNPFSAPKKEHEEMLLKQENIGDIITQQYDLVCNGREVGGGSIRAHRSDLLRSTFQIMGYEDGEIEEKFGHMISAFDYGTPPHGGCAHGFERLLMIMQNEEYIREVQAFPMSGRGHTAVMDAPSDLEASQLEELLLKVQESKKLTGGEEVYAAIVAKLKTGGIKDFVELEHEPVLTSADAARVRDTTPEQGAKALVMVGDKKPLMAVLSGSSRMDSKELKKLAKVKDLRMATPDEVKTYTSLPIGAIPPFGSLFGLPTFVEQTLGDNQEIVFNAGLHTKSIKMKYADWEKLESPQIGNFAQK